MKPICDRLVSSGIKTSLLFETYVFSSILENNITIKTNGLFTTYTSNDTNKQSTKVYDFVFETAKKSNIEVADPSFDNTVFLSSVSLQPIKLSAPLYANGKNDTDGDGLTDWEEVCFLFHPEDEEQKYGFHMRTFAEALDNLCDEEDPIYDLLKDKYGDKYDALCKMPFLYLLSDPTNKDTDDDGLNDNIDNEPFSARPPIIVMLRKMEKYVDEVVSSYAAEHDGCINGYYNSKITMNIIRSIRYNGIKWELASGDSYSSVKEWLNEIDPSILNYFIKYKDTPYIDPDGNEVDFIHMLATLSGQYKTSFFGKALIDDELSGWAGDLQSVIYNLKINAYRNNKDLKKEAIELFNNTSKNKNSNFSINDLLADIDAVNISNYYPPSMYLSDMIEKYYSINKQYKKRYSMFVNSYNGIDNLEIITGEYLAPIFIDKYYYLHTGISRFIDIKYYILRTNAVNAANKIGDSSMANVTEEETEALKYAFISYLKERIESE